MRTVISMLIRAAVLGLVLAGLTGPATAAETDGVSVDLVFGTEVDREGRAIVGASEAFAPDVDQVFCLSRIVGLAGDTTVTHAWYHEGQTMARVDLPVHSAHWRTWSSKRILPAWTGSWEVKVLDADGTVLASAAFEIR